MKKSRTMIILLAAIVLSFGTSHAQDAEFDLSSQRSESQDVNQVPGIKIDHKGLIINPQPHSIKRIEGKQLNGSNGFALKDKQKAFTEDLTFLTLSKKGTPLTIDFGAEKATKKGVKKTPGAYSLVITDKGIEIIGFDNKGAFYGIQTLRQIIESPVSRDGQLPQLIINDYPDMKYRGIVEGFYGPPWSHEVRLSLIDFYGKFKLNSYLYGPKDDPYHSSPNWRLPYPENEAKNIKELVEACNRNRVEFIWAIHPGKDIKWNEEDYQNLLNKFGLMYDLGIRSFAIFFDDIEGEGTNPVKQTELLNRLNRDFVEAKGNISSLVMCPTDYSKLWANPTDKGSLVTFGNTLDRSINMFWTGDVVCSDLTKETMDWFNSRVKRPGYFWWNYPVTDYVRNIVMQGPVYGLDTSLTPDDIVGLASNPMEHGEASKLALYSVADYTWNVSGYNPIDSWERGLSEITPEAKEAYRTFAIHSCDTETGYRRAESWETQTFRINNFSEQQFNELYSEFEKVEQAPAILEAKCKNKLLMNELHPWLTEFSKMGTRGKKTLDLIKIWQSGDNAGFWDAYVSNLMNEEQRKAYNEHKSGTMKLQPFYENAMDDMVFDFYSKLTGEVPQMYLGVGSFNNLSTILSKQMFDNDSTTHYTSGVSQKTGNWIGADLRSVRDISEISILQGRNSVDDVDYFDNTILEYSADGKTWNALTDSLEKQYIIKWSGSPVKARYIRIRKLPSAKKSWAAVRVFDVNPVKVENLGFPVEAADIDKVIYAFDNNPTTSFKANGEFCFGVKPDIKTITILTSLPKGELIVKQLSADNKVISVKHFNKSFVSFRKDDKTKKVVIECNTEIFEVICQ